MKDQDLQISAVTTSGSATRAFSMAHKMGLIQINMAKATAPETRTYTANSVTTAYDSGNVEFYALNVFDGTNLPYSASCPGTVSYFIVKHSNGSYSFTTPYKALSDGSTTGAVSQWTMSAVTAPASGKCTSATTSDPMFKNLGRLYSYTNTVQTYTPMLTGFKYKMECWGAQGGDGFGEDYDVYTWSGYVSGEISLTKNVTLYVYVGKKGDALSKIKNYNPTESFNGGGAGSNCNFTLTNPPTNSPYVSASGGGATDIRTKEGLTVSQVSSWTDTWNNIYGLRGRIIVAAGGGGEAYVSHAGRAGGITGYGSGISNGGKGTLRGTTGATQTSGGTTTTGFYSGSGSWKAGNNGSFGFGGTGVYEIHPGGGGGGGYWGGASGAGGNGGVGGVSGSGGSSYISGHPGCVAIESATSTSAKSGTANTVAKATHYSGLYFTNTKMIDGAGYAWTTSKGSLEPMPDPTTATSNYASGVGHTGNGYARITCKPYD